MRRSYTPRTRKRKVVVKDASILASIGFMRMMKLFLLGALFGSVMTIIAEVHFLKIDLLQELSGADFSVLGSKSEVVETKSKKAEKPKKSTDEGVKFEFYNILQGEKSGHKNTADYALKNDYFLKIASLQSEEDADMLRQKLEENDHNVTVKSVEIDGVSWWRVYVGPFKTLRETYDMQNNLRSDDIDSILVKGSI